MSDNNNVENDNDDYVYLKRPYLFNIRYNSRQVWNKLPDEEKAPYVNYEEYYEEPAYKVEKHRISDTGNCLSVFIRGYVAVYYICVYRI